MFPSSYFSDNYWDPDYFSAITDSGEDIFGGLHVFLNPLGININGLNSVNCASNISLVLTGFSSGGVFTIGSLDKSIHTLLSSEAEVSISAQANHILNILDLLGSGNTNTVGNLGTNLGFLENLIGGQVSINSNSNNELITIINSTGQVFNNAVLNYQELYKYITSIGEVLTSGRVDSILNRLQAILNDDTNINGVLDATLKRIISSSYLSLTPIYIYNLPPGSPIIIRCHDRSHVACSINDKINFVNDSPHFLHGNLLGVGYDSQLGYNACRLSSYHKGQHCIYILDHKNIDYIVTQSNIIPHFSDNSPTAKFIREKYKNRPALIKVKLE